MACQHKRVRKTQWYQLTCLDCGATKATKQFEVKHGFKGYVREWRGGKK